MRSWKSALNAVLLRSARSTHASPSVLRRFFMPFSYVSSRLIACPFVTGSSPDHARSGEIGCQRSEQLVHREFERARVARRTGAEPLEVGAHALGFHDEARADELEEVEARAQAPREIRHDGELCLPAAERALVLAEGGRVQRREQSRRACRAGKRVHAAHGIALV